MDANLLVRSKFMVSREFGTGDIPREPMPTIAGVTKPLEADEATRDWWLVTFAESWAKPLKVNTTHQQALILMFGPETDRWKGKRIGLFAMVGEFFKKRQTAVRIKGSPDITAPCSFSVRKWGGGRDTYDLIPLGAGAASASKPDAAAPFIPDGTVRIGPKKGEHIAQLSHEELRDAIQLGREQNAKAKPGAKWIPASVAHLAELEADQVRRAKLEEQMVAAAPKASRLPIEDVP
jgi:hypothetical protein